MNTYPAGLSVAVSMALVDLNGAPVEPTALSYRVEDDAGGELLPDTVLPFEVGTGQVTLTVPASINALPPGHVDGLRSVILSVVTPGGVFEINESYLLRGRVRLIALSNSFQAYESAVLMASRIPGMMAWNTAKENDRVIALLEAFTRLTRFTYQIPRYDAWLNEQDYLLPATEEIISPLRWESLTQGEWNSSVFNRFRLAICRAQVLEADDILGFDPITEKRRLGLVSETIGESSSFFRSAKPLERGASNEALNALKGFLQRRQLLTRT